MNPVHHAESSARKYGGQPEHYLEIHQWFDASKMLMPDVRHRALRHHTEGIFLAERLFGPTITNANGRRVPTRFVGEQHVLEDLGRIPTVQDWLECLAPLPWMLRTGKPLEQPDEEHSEVCECGQPGYFYSGVPGVIARVVDGRLVPGAAVERCDLCQRFPSDAAALEHVKQLGIA